MLRKIAIFCGGPSSEHEVSLNSAKTIFKFIDKKKYEAYFFYISKDNNCKLILGQEDFDFSKVKPVAPLVRGLENLKTKKIFALLAGIHGEFVEDGRLQVFLEYFKIPYSGSNPTASSLCMDKFRSMMLVRNLEGIVIPETTFYEAFKKIPNVKFPVFVKPNLLGSSVGSFKAGNKNELKRAISYINDTLGEDEILIQEYIGGIEFSCGVLEDGTKGVMLLPPIEIHPKKASTFDYASKYEKGGSEEITPPKSISIDESNKISELTRQIHNLLGCRTYSRSDFKYFENKIFYLETNTLPGMTSTSLLPQEAAVVGIGFSELLDFIIKNSDGTNN